MILTRLVILLCGLLFSSSLDAVTAQSPNATKTFMSSQALFANPERGWIAHRFSNDWWGIEDLRNSAEKVSLVLVKIDISAYVNSTSGVTRNHTVTGRCPGTVRSLPGQIPQKLGDYSKKPLWPFFSVPGQKPTGARARHGHAPPP